MRLKFTPVLKVPVEVIDEEVKKLYKRQQRSSEDFLTIAVLALRYARLYKTFYPKTREEYIIILKETADSIYKSYKNN